jgi:hypothetical protein
VSVIVDPAVLPDGSADDSKGGAALLTEVRSFIKRFCSFPDEHSLTAVTLWAAHAHMVRHFHTTPCLALISPEPGSGKTRVLEILDLLVSKSLFCLSASAAAIFRTLAKGPVTLLVDECDTIFTRRGRDDANEDLRALLNFRIQTRGYDSPVCWTKTRRTEFFGLLRSRPCRTRRASRYHHDALGSRPYAPSRSWRAC